MHDQPAIFEEYAIRGAYDAATETWWFSVVDIIQVLTQQLDYQTARKYWNKLKERLSKEGNESMTNCHRLKLSAVAGKNYLTDCFEALPKRRDSAPTVFTIESAAPLSVAGVYPVDAIRTYRRPASADFSLNPCNLLQ
jgi:hypothetical protein